VCSVYEPERTDGSVSGNVWIHDKMSSSFKLCRLWILVCDLVTNLSANLTIFH